MTDIREIDEKYKPEMALTILVCRVYLEKASAGELHVFVTTSKIDWRLFERIITAHQVRPMVYKVLSALPAGIDAAVLERLRKNCFHIATGNLGKLEELVRINKLFSAHGIKNVPYKGVILSWFLFGDFISRETVDIDFLINATDLSKAHKILVREGYSPRYYNPDFEEQIIRTSHELQFVKTTTGGEIKIEIHWAATNQMMDIPLSNADIFQNPDSIKLLGSDMGIFNLQNHLLVLMVHHGVNDIWRTLRHSLDVSLYLEKYRAEIDWQAFHEATIKYKIRHTTEIGFAISTQLSGIATPEIFCPNVRLPEFVLDNLLRFPAIKKRKLNIENFRQQLFLRDSFIDKMRLLGSYIHTSITPNIRDMEAFPITKTRYPLYYFIKPFRILFRTQKK